MKTNSPYIFIFLILVLVLASCASAQQNTPTASQLVFEDCRLSMPGLPQRLEAKCTHLTVYEDRQSGKGRQIELKIAKIPAISRNPAPDPLFFVPGGPGEAATQSFIVLRGAFDRIMQKRDIILVDQRGVGGSHPLDCEPGEAEQTEAEFLQTCLSSLSADPRFYTTAIAMDDLDEVRQTLGYEKINLYGASYGTRAVLAYARQHPEHVRAMILDGVAPPNWTLGPHVAADGQRALGLIFQRCAAQPACQEKFPNLELEFSLLSEKLKAQPIEVPLDDPISGEPTTFTMNYESFASTLHSMSYAAETAALLPLMIHSAYESEDFRPLAAQALSASQEISDAISTGMRFSVVCAEDVPYYPYEKNSQGYMEDFVVNSFIDICQPNGPWPQGVIPDNFKDPVYSEAPTLILSGEADPVTPPANGELAAQTLPNNLHVIVQGMGHINIYRGCVPRLAATFIENGSIQKLDAGCVQFASPLPFFINFSGPTP